MKLLSRLMPMVCICLISQAYADPEAEPAQPSVQAPSTTQSAPTTPTSASSTEASSTTPAEPEKQPAHVKIGKVVLIDKTVTDTQVRELIGMGYKPEARGDQVVYCRRETILGSRFDSKVCRSADQIALLQRDSKEMADTLHQRGATPSR